MDCHDTTRLKGEMMAICKYFLSVACLIYHLISYVTRTGHEFFPDIMKIDVASGLIMPVKAVPKTIDLADPERFITRTSTSHPPFKVVNPFDIQM